MSIPALLSDTLKRTMSKRSLHTIKEDMEDQEALIEKNQIESEEPSLKLAEDDDGSDFMEITIAHCPNAIPATKYHASLGMTSKPTLSQKEYEDIMFAKHEFQNSMFAKYGFALPEKSDDTIVIVCKHNGNVPTPSNLITTKRSALERSPVLTTFFKSSDYLAGCGIHLEFHNESTDCFQVIEQYLENGPDIYTAATLRHFATREPATQKTYNFLLLTHVHQLAAKLGLRTLSDLAYTVLHQIECSVALQDCINIAPLVYNPEYNFNNAMKNWLLEQISRYFRELSTIHEWAEIVFKSNHEFKIIWAELTLGHLRPVSTIHSSTEATNALLSTFPKPPMTGNENEKPLPAKPAAQQAIILEEPSDDESTPMPDYSKARRVLGMDEPELESRMKKPSGLSRASRSILGLMKRE